MRNYDYTNKPKDLLTPEIVGLLTQIHEHKGRQTLFIEANLDVLSSLLEVATIQSTGASNRIEGIFTTDKRLKELVKDKAEPKNRSEQEIVGYRDVLSTIHESYDYIDVSPNIILQLHRDLYAFSNASVGGNFKNADNVIAEVDEEGKQRIRFKPVSSYETKGAIEQLCMEFSKALAESTYDPLILITMFILDFLCIHPFNDGNGRMSRLLTLLLLYKNGYIAGKYISIEMLIEKSKETYYEALQDSSEDWHENTNRYEPFVKYYLGILLKVYLEFEQRVEHLRVRTLSKPDRIRMVINGKIGKITKREIMEACPDISKVTVERTLTELVKTGIISKVGAGPGTAYVKVNNDE